MHSAAVDFVAGVSQALQFFGIFIALSRLGEAQTQCSSWNHMSG
jgi:hypothetical protein